MEPKEFEIIAKTAYEARRAFLQTQGDMKPARWEHAKPEVQKAVLNDVRARSLGYVAAITMEESRKLTPADRMAAVVYFSIISVMLTEMGFVPPVREETPESAPTGTGEALSRDMRASLEKPAPVVVQPAPNPPEGYAADPAAFAEKLEKAGDVEGAKTIREAEGLPHDEDDHGGTPHDD